MVVFSVTTCGKATDALSLLREDISKFDLVISDVYMPDMDGFKLLELVGLEMDLPVISKYQLYGALLCIFIYLCGFSFFFPFFFCSFFFATSGVPGFKLAGISVAPMPHLLNSSVNFFDRSDVWKWRNKRSHERYYARCVRLPPQTCENRRVEKHLAACGEEKTTRSRH